MAVRKVTEETSKEEVGGDELLYRRIIHKDLPPKNYVYRDNRCYVIDLAFSDRDRQPSVDRACLCPNGPLDSKNRLNKRGGEKNGVAVLVASEVKDIPKINQIHKVGVVPDRKKANEAHALIVGAPPFTEFSFDILKKRLARLANNRPLAIEPSKD